MSDLYIMHYGVGHDKGGHSGRYPWGSGENPYNSLSASAKKKLVKESKKDFEKTNPYAAKVSDKLQRYGRKAAIIGGATTLLAAGIAFAGTYYEIPAIAMLGYDLVAQGGAAATIGTGNVIAGKAIKNVKSKNNARKKFNDSIDYGKNWIDDKYQEATLSRADFDGDIIKK